MSPDTARPTLRLTLACDSSCVFCAQEGLPRAHAVTDPSAELEALRARGADEVTFVGGEPALSTVLPEAVARARALGMERVGVQTNGVALAEAGALGALAGAGLTDVHLSIHGASAEVHDHHTGRPGSFEAACRTLGESRRLGMPAIVTTVLTRSSYRVIADLPVFLSSRGVAAWCIETVRTAGRAVRAFDRIVPRLALAIPFALHALDSARTRGLDAWIRGAPSCLLGPFASAALDLAPSGPASAAAASRAYGAPCGRCGARALCPGVDAQYLARFGDDELRPRDAVTPGAWPWPARAFVGVGELGPGEGLPAQRALDVVP